MRKVIGLLGVKGAGKDTCAQYLVKEAGFVRIGFADALYREVVEAFGIDTQTLGNRATKETGLPVLALKRCADLQFVEVAIGLLTRERSLRRGAIHYLKTGKYPKGVSRRRINELLDTPRSPRWTMQLWGTEYRRQSKYGVDSYWLDRVRDIIDANPAQSYVVTDVRFRNEAGYIRSYGTGTGLLCRVRRPELEEREARDRAARGTAAHPSETELLGYPVDVELFNIEGNPASLRDGILALAGHAATEELAA